MRLIPELRTENLIISVLKPENFELLTEFKKENRQHLSKWEPIRSDEYFDLEETKESLISNFEKFESGSLIALVGFNKEKSKIICLCTFSNITYGVFQACNLGYSVSVKEQGKGLMFEMLQTSIQYIFDEYKLHRIMANFIPSNTRSEKLLDRLGFEKEGLAKSYLKIAGVWQDHVLTSKLNPN